MSVFLLTDIEGSTEKWEKYQEEMDKALSRHDVILKENIERFGGKIVKHTGDGVFAVFEDGDPLGCALTIQRQFTTEDWGAIGTLRIRVGLHAGYAEKRGEDFFGPVVNRTARLMAAAWGGQVLLTPEVANSCKLPSDAKLDDLGVHLLKDLGEPQQIYELVDPDLKKEFPPIQSLSAKPHNLTSQPTPFLDRKDELGELSKLLNNPSCRLLTLVGPGGIGKTRLALQIAADEIESYRHGVYYIPLASLTLSSAQFLVFTIADCINFSFYSKEDPKVQLFNYLREKEMLLIMDNFEHLLEEVELLAEIIKVAPKVKIVVGSRERLNLKGEHTYKTKEMSYPKEKKTGEFENYGAVQLFIQGARRIDPDFIISEEDKPDVIRICEMVGGLPLGIELASAWVRSLSVKEIVSEIEKNLDFLATSMRDMPERHRSLRAVFDYSWNLLSEPEKEAFMSISVFRGGFTKDSAVHVTGVSLRLLTTLMDKSLLWRIPNGTYQMLEIIRQNAEAKLKESPEKCKEVKDLHCEYFADFVYERQESLRGKIASLGELNEDIENVLVAWDWAVEHQKLAEIEKLVEGLFHYYERRSWFQEGIETFEKAIKKIRSCPLTKSNQRILAFILSRQGKLFFNISKYNEAKDISQESLDICQNLGEQKCHGFSLNTLAIISWVLGDFSKAEKLLRKAASVYEEIDYSLGIAGSIHNQGIIADEKGDYQEAKKLFRKGMEIFKKQDDLRGLATSYNSLGVVLDRLGEYEDATTMYKKSLEVHRELDDQKGVVPALSNLGILNCVLGNYSDAKRYLEESLEISQEIGDRRNVGDTLTNLAEVLFQLGKFDEANRLYLESLEIMKELSDPKGMIYNLLGLGIVCSALDKNQEAMEFYRKSLKDAIAIEANRAINEILCRISEIWLKEEKDEQVAEFSSFVINNTASDVECKRRAEGIISKTKTRLSSENFTAAVDRGKRRKLEEVVKQVLGGEE